MTELIGISHIFQATYMRWLGPQVVDPGTPPQPRREIMEFYSGVIGTDYLVGEPIQTGIMKSFVPKNLNRKLLDYSRSTDIEITTVAHPAVFSAMGDDLTLIGVDLAAAQPEANRFPGIAGRPKVLVLSMNVAILRGTLIRTAYHIVIKSKGIINPPDHEEDPEELEMDDLVPVPDGSRPA